MNHFTIRRRILQRRRPWDVTINSQDHIGRLDKWLRGITEMQWMISRKTQIAPIELDHRDRQAFCQRHQMANSFWVAP